MTDDEEFASQSREDDAAEGIPDEISRNVLVDGITGNVSGIVFDVPSIFWAMSSKRFIRCGFATIQI